MHETATVKELLRMLDLTDAEGLWELVERTADDDAPAGRATHMLAKAAQGALAYVVDAELSAAGHLDTLNMAISREDRNVSAGQRRDGSRIAESAGKYAAACAAIDAGVNRFKAAAGPLALMLES